MEHPLLKWIVEDEGKAFQRIDRRWRPQDLLFIPQVRAILHDMQTRYDHLREAYDELQTLDRADKYIGHIVRMRLWLRQANFTWKGDQLVFIQAAAGFYSDYGAILRLLKTDEGRGIL